MAHTVLLKISFSSGNIYNESTLSNLKTHLNGSIVRKYGTKYPEVKFVRMKAIHCTSLQEKINIKYI